MEPGFRLEEYDNAIMRKHDERYVKILYEYEDFVKAYELTPELIEVFKEAGISVDGMGTRGLKPEEWGEFGSTVKTMKGFTEAYIRFRGKCVQVAKEVKKELGSH